jgi:pimeloyl-ACP methyl ester carboxylesterase
LEELPMRTKLINHIESSLVSADRKKLLGKVMLAITFCAGLALFATSASAQSNPRFVPLGAAKGALYVPDTGPAHHVAFLAVHRTSNFMTHVSTTELSKRGFMVLGMNPRFDNNEAAVNWEDIALDVRAGVRFLRAQPGITAVILIGHSGGGPTTSYYQAVAENGPAYCQGSNKLIQCDSTRLAGFTAADKADGIIFMDAHPGNTVNALRSLNPSLKKEQADGPIDKSLDPFSVGNGFNPEGNSVYSQSFQHKYFKAQSERMNDLIKKALAIRAKMQSGSYVPSDDDSFVVYRNSARLSDFSTGVHRGTLGPQKLLKDNGTIQKIVVNTVRIPDPGNKETDESFEGAGDLTITSFLSANAIRSTHSLDGIDWCSSNNSTICAVRQIRLPILVVAAQGHYFIRDGEQIFQNSVSADKDFVVIEGMTHGLGPCTACSAVTGVSYANARKNLFDLAASWANARF